MVLGRKRNNIGKDTKIRANLSNQKMSQELGISVWRLELTLFRAVVRDETEERKGYYCKEDKPCIRGLQPSYRHKI